MEKEMHIDLGVSPKEQYGDMATPMMAKDEMPEKVYPRFHYSGPVELELPDEGTMEIEFCKKSETSRVKEDGKHWYECDIEVKSICEVEGEEEVEPPTRRDTSAEDALDALAEKVHEKMMSMHKEENGNGNSEY